MEAAGSGIEKKNSHMADASDTPLLSYVVLNVDIKIKTEMGPPDRMCYIASRLAYTSQF